MKIKLPSLITTALLFTSSHLLAQDDDYDPEDARDFERFAHLGLSHGETISIVVGLILLFIARSVREQNKTISTILYVAGGLAVLPLVMVILAVAQKILGYVIILALIVGALYLLFGKRG